MGFINGNFPKADNANDVEWMISYWRITPCYSGCSEENDYVLESRQFDHLPKGATLPEAQALFDKYVADKKATGEIKDIKNLKLFLTRVVDMAEISDNNGKIIT